MKLATTTGLPSDRRSQQGGVLFLGALLIFFVTSILLYGLYAYGRRDDPESAEPLPSAFLLSTTCLIVVSAFLQIATRTVRRDKRLWTSALLVSSGILAVVFMGVQLVSMNTMLTGPGLKGGTGSGVVGMVAVLAFLHSLHVAGGIVAVGVVSVRAMLGRYDHERHWPVDFTAQYWHFLDVVWICMLAAFWFTTGGFTP